MHGELLYEQLKGFRDAGDAEKTIPVQGHQMDPSSW